MTFSSPIHHPLCLHSSTTSSRVVQSVSDCLKKKNEEDEWLKNQFGPETIRRNESFIDTQYCLGPSFSLIYAPSSKFQDKLCTQNKGEITRPSPEPEPDGLMAHQSTVGVCVNGGSLPHITSHKSEKQMENLAKKRNK